MLVLEVDYESGRAAHSTKKKPKTKAKEYIERGLKLLFTATGITVVFFCFDVSDC